MAQARTKSQQRKAAYRTARGVPPWIDGALRRAVHPDPARRYGELSEFVFDLRHPNADFQESASMPLIERNPLFFWQALSMVLACVIILLLLYPVSR